MRKRILVTGSSGFLGSWLVSDLRAAGHLVYGIDLVEGKNSAQELDEFFLHDLRSPIPWQLSFDVCIHLASGAGGFLQNYQDQTLLQSEILMVQNLRNFCAQSQCERFIFTSSVNVFETDGVQREGPLLVRNQRSPYAQAKAACEAFIQSEFKEFTILRPTNYFGPDQPKVATAFGESHVIPDLLEKIRTQDVVEVFGDGTQVRNFIHLSDLSDLILKLLFRSEIQFLHLRSDLFLSIRELVQLLMDYLQIQRPVRFLPEYLKFEPHPVGRFPVGELCPLDWHAQVQSLLDGLKRSRKNPIPATIKPNEIHSVRLANGLDEASRV